MQNEFKILSFYLSKNKPIKVPQSFTHPLQCKRANHIFSEWFNLHKSHLEVSVHLSIIGPIFIALNLKKKDKCHEIINISLIQVGDIAFYPCIKIFKVIPI